MISYSFLLFSDMCICIVNVITMNTMLKNLDDKVNVIPCFQLFQIFQHDMCQKVFHLNDYRMQYSISVLSKLLLMLENTDGSIEKRQSSDNGNIGYKSRNKNKTKTQ